MSNYKVNILDRCPPRFHAVVPCVFEYIRERSIQAKYKTSCRRKLISLFLQKLLTTQLLISPSFSLEIHPNFFLETHISALKFETTNPTHKSSLVT